MVSVAHNNLGNSNSYSSSNLSFFLNQLRGFQRGGNIRILHIGNIANNAYLAAVAERQVGIEAYVMSVDYAHIMGAPEWEHCKISRTEKLHFDKNFSDCACEYERPSWFYQGSMSEIERFLFSELTKDTQFELDKGILSKIKETLSFRRLFNSCISSLWSFLRPIGRKVFSLKQRAFIVGKFAYAFKKKSELDLTRLFKQFDIVNLYGASTSLISDYGPEQLRISNFVATEHGTLRDYIHADYPLSKDAKRGYEKSKVIFVTNQDCLPVANAMNNAHVFAMPHPINDSDFLSLRKKRLKNIQSPLSTILIPSRHSASLDIDRGKGNQNVYDLIKMCAAMGDPFKFRLVAWGDNVAAAKKYLANEETAGLVEWLDVMSRPLLKESMISSMCVLDQFLIEAYGAVTADALGLGIPVVTAHSCENDVNYFGSCAPVFNAKSANEIRSHLNSLLERSSEKVATDFDVSTRWFDQNLSAEIGLEKRLQGYLAAYRN